MNRLLPLLRDVLTAVVLGAVLALVLAYGPGGALV